VSSLNSFIFWEKVFFEGKPGAVCEGEEVVHK
jgi:hypothetical protein